MSAMTVQCAVDDSPSFTSKHGKHGAEEGFESGGKGEQAAGPEVPSGRTGLIFEV